MKLKRSILLDPNPPSDGDQGGQAAASAAVFSDDEAGAGDEAKGDEAKGDEAAAAGDEKKGEAAATAKPLLSVDEIAAALKKAGVGQSQIAPPAPKQWTEQDFNQAFKVFKPTKQHIAQLKKAITAAEGGDEEAIQVLDEMLQGTVKQAGTLAAYLIDDLKQKLDPQIQAMQSFITEQQERSLREEFYTANTDLKAYAPLVEALGEKLRASGFKGTKEEAFKVVAEQAHAVIATLPGGSAGGNGSGQPPKSTSSSRMSTLTSGGQGGVGDSTGKGGKKGRPAGMEVFE